jgi:hypothetical protein
MRKSKPPTIRPSKPAGIRTRLLSPRSMVAVIAAAAFESRQLSKECPSMTSVRKKLPAKFFARRVGCEARQGLCGR